MCIRVGSEVIKLIIFFGLKPENGYMVTSVLISVKIQKHEICQLGNKLVTYAINGPSHALEASGLATSAAHILLPSQDLTTRNQLWFYMIIIGR